MQQFSVSHKTVSIDDNGCRVLKLRQGDVMAQHPDACKVFGMPKAVIDSGLADAMVPLNQIATEILRLVE